jgi:hypothetical protein
MSKDIVRNVIFTRKRRGDANIPNPHSNSSLLRNSCRLRVETRRKAARGPGDQPSGPMISLNLDSSPKISTRPHLRPQHSPNRRRSTESGIALTPVHIGGKSSNSRITDGETKLKSVSPRKQPSPTNSTEDGRASDLSSLQPQNAKFSIRASFESGGNVTRSRQPQLLKHAPPRV